MKKVILALSFLSCLSACETQKIANGVNKQVVHEDESALKERKIRALEAATQGGHNTTHLQNIENNSSHYKVSW